MTNQSDENGWTDQDTIDFINYGKYFVPYREIQYQTILLAIPALTPGSYIVDLCCGDGHLCKYLLENIPSAKVLGLDNDEEMLNRSKVLLSDFKDRIELSTFDIFLDDWRNFNIPVSAFVSSLAIHHLEDLQKRRLFKDLVSQLSNNGCLVIADMVCPESEEGRIIAARQWDRSVMERSLFFEGSLIGFEAFQRTNWNYFLEENFENDPIDKPSTVTKQLQWMKEAGLVSVDVYWMMAGHAVFGGYKR